MRHHQPTGPVPDTPGRLQFGGVQAAAQGVGSLDTLQRTLGNRAVASIVQTRRGARQSRPSVQREPMVLNFDLNTDTGVPSHATLNIAALQGAITQKVTSSRERGLVLTALTQNQNASANDVPALAAILAAGQSPRTIAEVEEQSAVSLRGRTSRSGPRSRRRRTTPCSTPHRP